MADSTRDPLLDALADARPASADIDLAAASALRARLEGEPSARGRAPVFLRVAAAAVVVAGVAVGVVVANRPAHAPTVAMADVADQTTHAIAAASTGELEQVTTVETNSAGATVATADVWSYDGQRRVETLDASGNPVLDAGVTVDGQTRTAVVVDYATQWYRESVETIDGVPAILSEVDPGQQVRQEIADGVLTEVGSTTVDGAPAIELQSAATGFAIPATSASRVPFGLATGGPDPALMVAKMLLVERNPVGLALGGIHIWVDPTTYLPIQRVVTTSSGLTLTSTFTWSAPTATALANLTVPIPSGFTAVPSASGARPLL